MSHVDVPEFSRLTEVAATCCLTLFAPRCTLSRSMK
jgi:hypothetical protein